MNDRKSSPTFIPAALDVLRRRIVLRRLDSYVRGEQSPEARRETANLIARDDAAYALYRRASDSDRALSADFAGHGRPDRSQLDRAFANIGAALEGGAPLYRLRRLTDWRVSLIAICMAVILLLPAAVGADRFSAVGIPTQPQPRAVADDNVTPTVETPENLHAASMTPGLAPARFIARATPTAPDFE